MGKCKISDLVAVRKGKVMGTVCRFPVIVCSSSPELSEVFSEVLTNSVWLCLPSVIVFWVVMLICTSLFGTHVLPLMKGMNELAWPWKERFMCYVSRSFLFMTTNPFISYSSRKFYGSRKFTRDMVVLAEKMPE